MNLVLIQNSQVATYPYSLTQLKRDNPQVSFPANPPAELLESFGVFAVAPVAQPDPTVTLNYVEEAPQKIAGVWTQRWRPQPTTPEQASARQLRAKNATERAEIKVNASVTSFVAMAPAQVSAHVDGLADLAQLKEFVKTLALAQLISSRRELV